MRYLTREHTIRTVATSQEAANLISTKRILDTEALQLGSITIVANGQPKDPFEEIAILKQTPHGFFQIESLTIPWIPNNLLSAAIGACLVIQPKPETQPVNFTIGTFPPDKDAQYECATCGSFFISNAIKQKAFNKDFHLGICPQCEEWLHNRNKNQ